MVLDVANLSQLALDSLEGVKGPVSINTPDLRLPSINNILTALKVSSTNNSIVNYNSSG